MIITRNILLIFLALFLQTSWVDAISILGITPDLVLIVLVFVGITRGQIEATALGFLSGLLLDIYNPEWMGVNALANSLIGFAVGYTRIGIVAEDIQVQAAILFVATLVHDIIYFIFYAISNALNIFFLILQQGLGTALYTTVLGILISLALTRLFRLRIEPHA
jgi:rod shape-determining protein MreD